MELRKELQPPLLDENKVAHLTELAQRLNGCDSDLEDCASLRSQFNSLAGTNLQISDFYYSGGTDTDTFVRRALTSKPQKLNDITYEELLELMTRIYNADGTEYELDYWLEFLEVQLGNHKLSDLIYHPKHYFGDDVDRDEMTPKEILDVAITNKPKAILLPPSRGF